MGIVLDGLKERLDAAKIRQAAAHQAHQATAAELNAANTELNVWSLAYSIEAREEEKRLAGAREAQMDLPEMQSRPIGDAKNDAVQDSSKPSSGDADPINKTDLVRNLLRDRPHGITAGDVWKSLKEQMSSRAYLYSILKRLRDREEIVLRKSGKYVLKPKPVEAKHEESVIGVFIEGVAASASSLEGN